ncbi:DNA recombination protein RmuC [Sphingomonas parva]|uniref:DNA recombination protein RmuC homolog n=2 Tax=Sphingomonas parva TaxID=2555898 RepID=A0A4Y8ZYS0_9SPHN|nr:DNA recombination protein RmuC [Sphingomonas parva]
MEIAVYAALALALVAVVIGVLILRKMGRPAAVPADLSLRIGVIEQIASSLPGTFREEARTGREELRAMFASQIEALEGRFSAVESRLGEFGKVQNEQLSSMRSEAADGRAKLEESMRRNADGFAASQSERLKETNDAVRSLSERLLEAQREARQEQRTTLEAVSSSQSERLKETNEAVGSLSERLLAGQREARDEQRAALDGVTAKIAQLTESNETRQEALRQTVAGGLETLRTDNADKLEKMRATVEEKLQGTLEKRLGESFQLVSDRLEQVHKGLGEMQNLATGVGDLKRVLGNVKSRGGWGEVQLGMLLDDMLTRDQFATNVRIRPESGEVVEYAVRLPGRSGDDIPLWLPIDAKFPHEDYERLLVAQDAGVAEEVEKAAVALERAIRLQAKTICEKYVHPPLSTDFAIMYLPTEGLFAEVIRRPGLASELQTKHRVMVQGPTTLAALLTSLQMGFRTLAIEKRSSEVWQVLGAAKAEFLKYGQVWERLGKQLDTAKRTVDEAGRRTRAVTRQLREVETLDASEGPALLGLVAGEIEEEADAEAAE